MKKELNVIEKPPFTFLLYPAYRTSILCTNNEYIPWFLSSFSMLSCNKKNENDFGIEFESIPFIKEKDRIYKDDTAHSAIKRIIKNIDKNKYVSLTWDESVVSVRPHYSDEHYQHMVLICGYNLCEKTLTILGFSERNVYEKRKVSFIQFSKAYEFFSHSRWKTYMIKSMYHGKFLYRKFNRRLGWYLKSSYPLLPRMYSSQSFLREKCFGLSVYQCLISRINREKNHEESSFETTRALTAFFEHKHHLLAAFTYMLEYNLGKRDIVAHMCEVYSMLENEIKMIKRMYIKYTYTLAKETAEQIIEKINKIYRTERKALENYFNNI